MNSFLLLRFLFLFTHSTRMLANEMINTFLSARRMCVILSFRYKYSCITKHHFFRFSTFSWRTNKIPTSCASSLPSLFRLLRFWNVKIVSYMIESSMISQYENANHVSEKKKTSFFLYFFVSAIIRSKFYFNYAKNNLGFSYGKKYSVAMRKKIYK